MIFAPGGTAESKMKAAAEVKIVRMTVMLFPPALGSAAANSAREPERARDCDPRSCIGNKWRRILFSAPTPPSKKHAGGQPPAYHAPRFSNWRRQGMKLAWAVAIVVFAAFPAAAENAKSSIDQANLAFSAAFAKGDAAGLASLYTEQATILPPGAPMMKGRKNIEAFWRQAMSSLKNLQLKAVDVESFGTARAREIGTFTADAGQQQLTGKYVVIWKKSGKIWRLATDIWNTDK
jgi:uncharacterized protein (TIGR02246 family)